MTSNDSLSTSLGRGTGWNVWRRQGDFGEPSFYVFWAVWWSFGAFSLGLRESVLAGLFRAAGAGGGVVNVVIFVCGLLERRFVV